MKRIAKVVAIGLIGVTTAAKLRWIDGNFDDDEVPVNVDNKGGFHALMQTSSDPIYPSSGPTGAADPGDKKTPEQILEEDLSKRTPIVYTDEKETQGDTTGSIEWAEKNLKTKLELPKKSAVEMSLEKMPVFEIKSEDFEDDDEVKSTLRSAHQAEWLYGYHGYGPGNYSGGFDCEGYGNYTNGRGFGNGSYPSYNPWWGTYGSYDPSYNGWYGNRGWNDCNFGWNGYGSKAPQNANGTAKGAGNATVNTTDATVKGNTYDSISFDGYWGGWGFRHTHGHEGWRCKRPKNIDWWNHLIKDNGYEGMITSSVEAKNRVYWVNKEYKHVADIYCDEWETPYWYILKQEAIKKAEELAKKKAEEAAKNSSSAPKGVPAAAAPDAPPKGMMQTDQISQAEIQNLSSDKIEVTTSDINFKDFGLTQL